jgi:hypothetical protein
LSLSSRRLNDAAGRFVPRAMAAKRQGQSSRRIMPEMAAHCIPSRHHYL